MTEEKLIYEVEKFHSGITIFYRMGVEYTTNCLISENIFATEVLSELDRVKKRLGNKKYIGLHIRRTDHKQAIENSPIEFFKQAIEKEVKCSNDISFFLATDDQTVEEELTKSYGKYLLFNEGEIKERISAKAIQDAAVDLLMLSGAEKIYGSVGSTFSKMAAQIGNKPLILNI